MKLPSMARTAALLTPGSTLRPFSPSLAAASDKARSTSIVIAPLLLASSAATGTELSVSGRVLA